MNVSHCSIKNIGPMYVEVSGRSARNVPSGWDFLWFRPSLDSEFLQAQLIQNLWNLLELNKIWMEHSVKLISFPSSWRSKREIMAINSRRGEPVDPGRPQRSPQFCLARQNITAAAATLLGVAPPGRPTVGRRLQANLKLVDAQKWIQIPYRDQIHNPDQWCTQILILGH